MNIVDTLRNACWFDFEFNGLPAKAADEIERLRHNLQVTEQTRQEYEELAKLRLEEIERLRKERDELMAALEGVLPWVVTQTVACHGMKCREPICLSCTDEVEAESAAQTACDMYSSAKKAIASVKGAE